MSRPAAGRSSRRFRQLSANLRAERRPCCRCKQPIDYSLEYPHEASFSVEHILNWRDYPELREEPTNLDAAHLICNTTNGAMQPRSSVPRSRAPIGHTSREW